MHANARVCVRKPEIAKASLHARRGCLVPGERVDCIDLLAEGRSGRGMLLPQGAVHKGENVKKVIVKC